jgi:hypothetical protein
LQQTPSTQRPLAHWLAPEQAVPFPSSGVHTPAAHQYPEVQPASLVHPLAQALAPHTSGAHVCCCGDGQLPVPSQEAGRVATPPVQLPARHATDASG